MFIESLEGRQMFSTTAAIDPAATTSLPAAQIDTPVDSASPDFFRNCVAGAHYSKVTIEMRKAGDTPTKQ